MTSWFRSVFYHSLCVSHEFCFFFQFSFFSCFFLTHAALFCFLILHVSFKSKHLAGSNQRLVLRMPLDLVLPREAPKGNSRPSILNPLSVLALEKWSSWGKHLISNCICLQSFLLSPFLFFLLFAFVLFLSPFCLSYPYLSPPHLPLLLIFLSHFLLLLLPSHLVPGISFTPLIHTSSSHILSLLQIRQLNW